MSGSYDKKDGAIYIPKIVNKQEEDIFITFFDQQVDFDIEQERKIKEEEKLLYKMCIVRMLMFPFQYPLTRIFLGKVLATDLLICYKLYWKYLRKKMNTDEFKKQLTESLKIAKLKV